MDGNAVIEETMASPVPGQPRDWSEDIDKLCSLGDLIEAKIGFDHGVGHSLLLLYDAKPSHGQKIKEFNGLDHDLPNASIDLF